MATDHNFKVKKGLDVLGGDVNLGDGFAYKIDGSTVVDSSRNLTNIGTISTSGNITSAGRGSFSAGPGGQGLHLNSSSSWSSGTLYAPGLLWREADGTNIAGIRGYVNSNGDNHLTLGTGWLDHEVTISSTTVSVSGSFNTGGSITTPEVVTARSTGRQTVIGNSNGNITTKGVSGGWAFGYHALGSSSTDHGGFGFLGSDDSFSYYYIGASYSSGTNFRFHKNGTLKIGTTTILDSSRNLTNIGTISSGAITSSGAISASGALSAGAVSTFSGGTSDYAATFSSTDAYSGIRFQDPDGVGVVYYRGAVDHLYLNSSTFSVGGSTLATNYEFQVNGDANITGGLAINGLLAITSSRELQNLNGNVRSDSNFQFLTNGGSAQNVRTKSVFAGTTYGDTPPAGSVNATNTYELNGTTVIDSSRNLTNIGTISSGAITSSGTLNLTSGNIRLRNNVSGDGQTIRDIDFLTTAAEGTSDDRVAIVRGRTSAGTSTTRGGALFFYTRQANGSGFNETKIDHAGNLTVAGNVYLPQYLYHSGDTDTYIQFLDNRVRIFAGGTAKFDSNNTYQTTAAPSAVSITSSSIVSETVEIVFSQSSTSGVSRYEIWSDGGGSDFSLIGKINGQDAASSMSFVDTTFTDTGTINYRIYAVRYGIYSTAATTSVSFSQPSLDVTNFSAIADLNNFYLQYEKPDTRFLDHIEIYVDTNAASANLARSSASLIYSGDNSSYVHTISASDRNNFHQFWVECVGV